MIEAIILYGSRARGDERAGSDTDLLALTPGGAIAKVFDKDGVTLHLYPIQWMEDQARSGGLFLLHLTREGRTVWDPKGRLDCLRSEFRFRQDYQREIFDSLWILREFQDADPQSDRWERVRRWVFWACRTYFIALSAESRTPVFSASAIENAFGLTGFADFIAKRSTALPAECRPFAEMVLADAKDRDLDPPRRSPTSPGRSNSLENAIIADFHY